MTDQRQFARLRADSHMTRLTHIWACQTIACAISLAAPALHSQAIRAQIFNNFLPAQPSPLPNPATKSNRNHLNRPCHSRHRSPKACFTIPAIRPLQRQSTQPANQLSTPPNRKPRIATAPTANASRTATPNRLPHSLAGWEHAPSLNIRGRLINQPAGSKSSPIVRNVHAFCRPLTSSIS